MAEFTPKQGQYLSFIHAYIEGFGFPPAESEIATAMKVSPPSANQMMKTLEKRNLIRRKPGESRSIEILVSPDLIPKWKKRLVSTMKVWVQTKPPKADLGRSNVKGPVYQFKISLKDAHPPIWRQVQTQDVTLEELHELIQTAMGWTDSHLHQFLIDGVRYTDPKMAEMDGGDLDERSYAGLRVSDLITQYGTKLRFDYEYDFGDGWAHSIVLEKVTEAEAGVKYPRCIDGDRACPPEDVGGVWGYAEFVQAIADPNHPEHDEMLEWSGPFDPAAFNAKQATKRMQAGLPTW